MIKPKDLKIRIFLTLFLVAMSLMYILPFKEKINLGLDLKGGMYVVMKVDAEKLPPPQEKQTRAQQISQATEIALEVIRTRIDEFGVKEPSIQPQGKDSILVQLPGVVERDRALSLIGQTAFLEFRLVSDDKDLLKKALAEEPVEGYELKYQDDKPLLLEKAAPITGADLKDAQSVFDPSGFPQVSLSLNKEGAKKFADLTKAHVGERLAIVLDGIVKTAPVINEPILSGDAVISGDYDYNEARDIALILRAGALPAPLKIEEERTVGPLLGGDSINRGVNSILFGAGLVIVFMLIYYMLGGFVALLCIVLDLLFVLGGLSLLGATLTLPGIAGMILTLGMAVDGNVLIFERIREELELKKPLSLAVKNGFDRAKRTIFDANITTLIAAAFLFIYGTGPIRGFATTLMLGIMASIFTAVFIGRMVFTLLLNRGTKKFSMLKLLRASKFNFVKVKNICIIFSLILIVFGAFQFKQRGESIYGIDFTGGQLLEYKITPPVSIDKIREVLSGSELKGVALQEFKDIEGGVILRSQEDVTAQADKILKENFANAERLGISTIGPSVGKILRKKAVLAVLLSLLGILGYVALRFKHFDFAFAAVVAIFHDVLITMGFMALCGYEVTLLTITALLTIAGYSVNDTIVIYDRIRELSPKMYKQPFPQVINTAINQTLSRTIITSLTTIAVVVCIYLFGGTALRGFSFALLIGFVTGTYSSVYIASPLVLLFRRKHLHH